MLKPRVASVDLRTGRRIEQHATREDAERARKAQIDEDRRGDPIRALYKTRRWQDLRRQLYVERGGICECGCGRLTVLHQRDAVGAIEVAVFDHREGARERPELFFDPAHIRLMAKACHDARTARDQGFARR